ncbi:uncharacterized protein LOC144628202 [Oculina patagonica]
MANVGLERETPRVHNACSFPELTIYGPEITLELDCLDCSISVKIDADRVPPYYYWIVDYTQDKDSAVLNTLEAGDWITSISGANTCNKDETFLHRVKFACQDDTLILIVRKPIKHQEFNIWDPNQVTINHKVRLKDLPFALDIFHPDLDDNSKTYPLVDKIFQNKIDLKGLKRGDKVIAINEHATLQDKTYKELQQIIHQLNLQQGIKLTIQRRQWRQYGYLTRYAIDSPEYLGWRRLEAELKKSNPKMNYGFKFRFAQNQLEQPCPIVTQIAAGKTPAAMCSYLNPGCKITAINGQAVKGLTFNEVKTKLQRAKTSVKLSIEEPQDLLHEENFHNRDSNCTWPAEVENGYLRKSLSEAQIRYVNSFQADELPTIDLTCQQKEKGTSPSGNGAKPIPVPALGPLPSPPDQDMNRGFVNGASSSPDCFGIQESGTPLPTPPDPRGTQTDQDIPLCQNCLSISLPDKREQTIEHLPGEIYYFICLKLDIVTPFFHHDYRILGEKLGFFRPEISLLRNSDQPTDHLLNEWVARKGRGATVGVLMDVFDKTERHDLLDLLKTWTENCTKCFEYQQENVKETYI